MSRKRKLNLKEKNAVLILAFVLVISSLLTACGSSAEKSAETKEEVAADKIEEATIEDGVQVENKVEETVEAVESTENVETFQSAGAWAQSVDRTEPKMTIWNEITKEGLILENEQKYVLKEGDSLVICTKEEKSGLRIHSDLSASEAEYKSISSSSFTRFIFNKEILEETLFEVDITVAGMEYTLGVTLISESATTSVDEVSESTDMSGKEWANSLEYEEPKLIAWNDETGTREVIENGGQYNMQHGDVLAVYHPSGYFVSNALPIDFGEELLSLGKCTVILGINLDEYRVVELEVEVMNPEDEFETFNYVVTTPEE